jgi:hypothetical protein
MYLVLTQVPLHALPKIDKTNQPGLLDDTTTQEVINLLYTPNISPSLKKNKRLPQTKASKPPTPTQTPTQSETIPSYLSKHIFSDDTTQTIPLNIDHTHLASLDGTKFLCTGLIEYLIHQSIK